MAGVGTRSNMTRLPSSTTAGTFGGATFFGIVFLYRKYAPAERIATTMTPTSATIAQRS
jgi:hypothetical protein